MSPTAQSRTYTISIHVLYTPTIGHRNNVLYQHSFFSLVPAYVENESPEFVAEYIRRRFRVAHENARKYVKNESKIRVGTQDRRFQRPFLREFILNANVFDEVARDKFVQLGLDTTNDFEVRAFAPPIPPVPNNLTGRFCISPDEINAFLDEIGGKIILSSYFLDTIL